MAGADAAHRRRELAIEQGLLLDDPAEEPGRSRRTCTAEGRGRRLREGRVGEERAGGKARDGGNRRDPSRWPHGQVTVKRPANCWPKFALEPSAWKKLSDSEPTGALLPFGGV